MSLPNTSPIEGLSQQVSQDASEVTIAQSNAITLAEALVLARQTDVAIGKSTLQRWAKAWTEIPNSPVKAILQVTRTGRHYEIDRDDYESWLLEQAENQQTPADPLRSDQVLQDLKGLGEVPEGLTRSSEASRDDHDKTELQAQVHELEAENLQLRIDVGVRRELVAQAKTEMDTLRGSVEQILKQNGALEFQLRQLAPPSVGQDDVIEVADREGDNEEGLSARLL